MASLGLHGTCPGLPTSRTAPFSRDHMSLCFGLIEQKSGAVGLPGLLFASSGPVPDRSRNIWMQEDVSGPGWSPDFGTNTFCQGLLAELCAT